MAKKYKLTVRYNDNVLTLVTYDKDKIDQEMKELLDDVRLERIFLVVVDG